MTLFNSSNIFARYTEFTVADRIGQHFNVTMWLYTNIAKLLSPAFFTCGNCMCNKITENHNVLQFSTTGLQAANGEFTYLELLPCLTLLYILYDKCNVTTPFTINLEHSNDNGNYSKYLVAVCLLATLLQHTVIQNRLKPSV